MSTYPETSSRPSAGTARPATLIVAVGAAILAGLAAIVNGALVVLDAAGVLVTAVSELTGQSVEQAEAALGGPEAVEAMLDGDDAGPLFVRAYAVLISGALLLIFGLLMRKAATWARVMVTIAAVATAGFSLLVASLPDEGTDLMVMLGWIGVPVALIALVTTWLPANGRYAKAVR